MTAAREIAPGIWSSPTRLGGLPTVGDTRLPVSAVTGYVRARRSDVPLSVTMAAAREEWPQLSELDVERAVAFDAGARWYADAMGVEYDG